MARIGPYEILGRETCAGAGLPYRVQATGTDRIFTLKALPESNAATDEAAGQLVRELRELRHPNVLSPEAHGTDAGGAVFLIYPAVECTSLRSIIEGQRLREQQLRDIAMAVASALEAAHRRGLHHGGLQPKSVLMTSEGTVLVTDFMLTRVLDPRVESAFSAPRAYVAPESDTGAPASADMYALGAILLEAMDGAAPGIAADDGASEAVPDISPDFTALVRSLLSPRSEERPSASQTLSLLTDKTTPEPFAVMSPAGRAWGHRPRSSDISLFEHADDARERPLAVWLGAGVVAAVALLAMATALLFVVDADPNPERRLDARATLPSTIPATVAPTGTREAVAPAVSVPSSTVAPPSPVVPQAVMPQEPAQSAPAPRPAEAASTVPAEQAGNDQAVAAAEVVARRATANSAFYRTRDLRAVAGLVTGRALQTYTEEAARLTAIDAYIESVQTGLVFEGITVSGGSAVVVTVETWEHTDRRASTGEVTGSRRATARITYELTLAEGGWLIENITHSILAIGPL
jgi:serine/threonine protein kinase